MKLLPEHIDQFVEQFIANLQDDHDKDMATFHISSWGDLASIAARRARQQLLWNSTHIEVSQTGDQINEVLKSNSRLGVFMGALAQGAEFYDELQSSCLYPDEYFGKAGLENRVREAVIVGQFIGNTIEGIDGDVANALARDQVVGGVLELRRFLTDGDRKKTKFISKFGQNEVARALDAFLHAKLKHGYDSDAEGLVRTAARARKFKAPRPAVS